MSSKFTAIITREENWYVAHCLELGVVSQGKTIEQAQVNLKEAVELYLESFGTEDIPGDCFGCLLRYLATPRNDTPFCHCEG